MTTLLVILAVLILVAIMVGPLVFLEYRKIYRDQKNYERALKTVPLLIHLPPPSDDTEVGSRDVRDVTEETISKAELVYNIIASTYKSGMKANFFGQRHFAFEIVGSQGFVNFYAAVPVSMLDVIKQAINSAYPSARLEEVAEHNIFNQVGKINGTLGGELYLKKEFAYPIATYQEIKRDAMQSLLNSLWTLGKEDGAGIQFLIRPANPAWQEQANKFAGSKRKGSGGFGGPADIAKSLAVAFIKPPEHSDGGDGGKKDLSNLEQSTFDAIDEKTRHPGFEIAIRVVASSNITERAQAILNNVVASFSLYDAPGKNGFKYTAAKNVEELTTAYIMRFFPQQPKKSIVNSVELATLFHFPDERSIPTSQLVRQDSKQVDGPRNIPEEGMLLGYNIFRGAKKPIRLSQEDRSRHMYVVGQTGTGKSTFLENLALQDMLNGNGFAFVDPHGDTAEKLLSMVPKERTEDIIYFSPADMEHPMGLNLFEFESSDQKDFLIQEALNMLYKLYDPQHQGIMGPRYEHLFRNAALTIMADPEGGTFVDIPKLFRDPGYVQQKLQHVDDISVRDFWLKEMPASQRSNEFGEVTNWFISKFGAFLSNEMMRNIIGQTKSAFDLREIMDQKKILLVNLSKGRTGELNSKLLGMIFVMKFQAAAMSRANLPESDRIDFCLYVDEFQNFSTESFATIMSEARKYHLNLIVANQFTTQLTQEIRDSVFGNMGTIISFRIGQNDVEAVGQYFQPTFDSEDLLRLPNFNTIVRTLVGGVPTHPFSMATLPGLGTPNPRLGAALKQLSAAKHGRPRKVVGQEITARMTTRRPAIAPTSGSGFGQPATPYGSPRPLASANPNPAYQARPAQPPPAMPGTGNFLDEWMTKRQSVGTRSTPAQPGAYRPPPTPIGPQPPAIQAPVGSTYRGPSQAAAAFSSQPAFTSAAAPPPPPSQPTQPGPAANISSHEIEQTNIDKIASEIKQDMTKGNKPSKAAPVIKTEHNLDLSNDDGDTIYIDREGHFMAKPARTPTNR